MSGKKNEGTKNYIKTAMPDCSDYKAYVLPGAFYGACVALMAEAGFERANCVADADVVVFIGGEDIDPSLYKAKPHATTYFNTTRDLYESTIYDLCVKKKKPMFGICRGAQFLHAKNGGQLWQDVNGHGGNPHVIVDIEDDVRVVATSLHHQMLKDHEDLCVIAVTEHPIATTFADGNMHFRTDVRGGLTKQPMEIEAGCYVDTGCFFVQGHPEIGSAEYRAWCMSKLYMFLIEWEVANSDPNKEVDNIEAQKVLTQLS